MNSTRWPVTRDTIALALALLGYTLADARPLPNNYFTRAQAIFPNYDPRTLPPQQNFVDDSGRGVATILIYEQDCGGKMKLEYLQAVGQIIDRIGQNRIMQLALEEEARYDQIGHEKFCTDVYNRYSEMLGYFSPTRPPPLPPPPTPR